MNLTINDLQSLKSHCKDMFNLIDDIQKSYNPSSLDRKLFVSRRDYDESLKIKNELPQDFYFFRCFDVFCQIVYHKSQKVYLIYLDGFYSHLLDKYERLQRNEKSYIISKDFDKTLSIFQDIINDIINNKVLQNGLF